MRPHPVVTALLAVSVLVGAGCAPRPPDLPGRQPTSLESTLDRYRDFALTNVRARKLAVYAATLRIGQEQANGFWPLWRDYEVRLAQFDDGIDAAQQGFALVHGPIDQATAEGLAKRLLDAQRGKAQLQADAYDRFVKVIGVREATRWLMIERQLATLGDLRAAAQVPLVPTGDLANPQAPAGVGP